jgi:hypothetical protein
MERMIQSHVLDGVRLHSSVQLGGSSLLPCFFSLFWFFHLGVPAVQLVGRRSWRRGQTAGGDSIPRWPTGEPQVVTRRKVTGAGQKKLLLSLSEPSFRDIGRN